MTDQETSRAFNKADALAMWRELEREVSARGWHLSVGCGTVHIVIPGDGGPQTDQYVEVAGG